MELKTNKINRLELKSDGYKVYNCKVTLIVESRKNKDLNEFMKHLKLFDGGRVNLELKPAKTLF